MERVVYHEMCLVYEINKSMPKRKHDEYLTTLKYIFTAAQWFGIPTFGGTVAFVWSIILLLLTVAIEVGAIWKVIIVLAGRYPSPTGDQMISLFINTLKTRTCVFWQLLVCMTVAALIQVDRGNVTSQLSGALFYGNALFSLLLTWRFVHSWKGLSFYWARAETTTTIYFPPDVNLRRRVIIVTCFVTICAAVEHMLSMMAATGFNCPVDEYFQRYILSSHGFLLHPQEYTLWLAIPIFIMSKLATILWNFQDLMIILISMGLTSRYRRLNSYVKRIVDLELNDKDIEKFRIEPYIHLHTWRKLREAYVSQAALVRRVAEDLGALVLLSNFNNFYFICLQLFLAINKSHGPLVNHIYYLVSLGWLIFRACSVVLAAADVNLHSQRALSSLHASPALAYNVEIRRLKNQLTYDVIVLHGMKFFALNRQMLLQVAANIIKYELVLLEFDK